MLNQLTSLSQDMLERHGYAIDVGDHRPAGRERTAAQSPAPRDFAPGRSSHLAVRARRVSLEFVLVWAIWGASCFLMLASVRVLFPAFLA